MRLNVDAHGEIDIVQRLTMAMALVLTALAHSGTAAVAPPGASMAPADVTAGLSNNQPAHPWMSEIEYVQLPFGLNEPSLLVCSSADWQRYLDSNGPGRTPEEAPCDLDQRMLVAWRASSGVSGCVEPPAGIDSIREDDDRIFIDFYSGNSMGHCMRYHRPVVAACLPRSTKVVEIVPDHPGYVSVPDVGMIELETEEGGAKPAVCEPGSQRQADQNAARNESRP